MLCQRLIFLLLISCTSIQCTSDQSQLPDLETGVSYTLAQARFAQISNLVYDFSFSIPEKKDDLISATVNIQFDLQSAQEKLILDFQQPADHIQMITVNQKQSVIQVENDHIIIPKSFLHIGTNTIHIAFIAGEMSMNRSEEYLYTLLVPDRASTVFPCFDQPNLKASFKLHLNMPADWIASANGALDSSWVTNKRKHIQYLPTKPFSTYVFGFAAGKFKAQQTTIGNRTMRMLYRETDTTKVSANITDIFKAHADAIRWMEAYTGIDMPFRKMDFVLIPGFQYGGMEHIGNIFYRESSLMLESDASQTQKLRRARLIAHETAHMWFGNLVTMDWFNDVWLKEVFANFMAAKMVNPTFPDINHDLNFLWSHLPSAFSEDRSRGSHPIQQKLDNLKDAGTLYGRIIYQKAPVVMRQLESQLGEENFQQGLAEYLQQFAYANATWDDLIHILDQKTNENLKAWSEVWVKRANMPTYTMKTIPSPSGTLDQVIIQAENTTYDNLFWNQMTTLALIFTPDSCKKVKVNLKDKITTITFDPDTPLPKAILPNASPMSYGFFDLKAENYDTLIALLPYLPDPIVRATIYWSLYEAVTRHTFPATTVFDAYLQNLSRESDPLNQQRILSYAQNLFWQYIKPTERKALALASSQILREALSSGTLQSVQNELWNAYRQMAISPAHQEYLYRIWLGDEPLPFLTLTENRRIALAASLAIYLPKRAEEIIETESRQIQNPDQQERFVFLSPALSPDIEKRITFFESLKNPINRAKEPWVSAGLSYLHHPLRAESALAFIIPALDMMPEIQTTGDIFFPRRWADANLSGHQSPEAARLVLSFMDDNPNMSFRLRNKIWMAADPLLRSARIGSASLPDNQK